MNSSFCHLSFYILFNHVFSICLLLFILLSGGPLCKPGGSCPFLSVGLVILFYAVVYLHKSIFLGLNQLKADTFRWKTIIVLSFCFEYL